MSSSHISLDILLQVAEILGVVGSTGGMVSISHISLDRVSKLISSIFLQIISLGVNTKMYKGQTCIFSPSTF